MSAVDCFFEGYGDHRDLHVRTHSCPTRRSSDLLAPKAWCRVHRFGRALERLAADPALFLADVAAAEGYADQAHFTREFRALAGLSPGADRRRAPLRPRQGPTRSEERTVGEEGVSNCRSRGSAYPTKQNIGRQ